MGGTRCWPESRSWPTRAVGPFSWTRPTPHGYVMVLLSLTDSSGRHRLPVAALLALHQGPTTDFELRVVPPGGTPTSIVLERHPRHAEPLIATVARGLSLATTEPHGEALFSFVTMVTCIRVELSEGRGVRESEVRESLAVQVAGSRMRVTWQDEQLRRVVEAPTRLAYRSTGALLTHAARLAAWGIDEMPPAPCALDRHVVITVANGADVVREEDIPYHALNEFRRRQPRILSSPCRAYLAKDWLAFLQG